MKDIEKEIEQTVNSFDERSEVKVKPYFYTRLSAKMDYTPSTTTLKWSIATMILIILINLISILSISTQAEEAIDPIDMMASEYTPANNDLYSITIE